MSWKMKTQLTTMIIGLLLVLPMAIAAETATAQDPAATATESAASDISQVCSERKMEVKAGDTLRFCNFDITTESASKDSVRINGEEIRLGKSHKFDGVKIIYEEFADDKATITLDTEIQKKLSSEFEKNKFKVFYEISGAPKLAGIVDASAGSIAGISYGDNSAYVRIRSSTPSKLTIGMDFENADKTKVEKIHIPWNIMRTVIDGLETEKMPKITSTDLFNLKVDGGVQLTLGESLYTVELGKLPGLDVNAIKIHSEAPFTVTVGNLQQQTNTIWITTKLAQVLESDTTCAYDVTGGSLDDFARRSSVQGYYPSTPAKFFDIFTSYCKDDKTLVHYGCVGLKADKWAKTSRVSFLEVTCPGCNEGACTEGPYCMDSDKYAQDSTKVKGKMTIFTKKTSQGASPITGSATVIPPANYDDGIHLLQTQTFEDQCSEDGTRLTEYICKPENPQGYETQEITCNCASGACTDITAAAIVAPQCTNDADCTGDKKRCSSGTCVQCAKDIDCKDLPQKCPIEKPLCNQCSAGVCQSKTAATPPEDLAQLRTELKDMEDKVSMLKTMFEKQRVAPPPTTPKQGIVQGILSYMKLKSKPQLAEQLNVGKTPELPESAQGIVPSTPSPSTEPAVGGGTPPAPAQPSLAQTAQPGLFSRIRAGIRRGASAETAISPISAARSRIATPISNTPNINLPDARMQGIP